MPNRDMFFEEDRIRAVREMILAEDEKTRRAALAKLLPMQRADFAELFKIMGSLPVTIRLLDPPLHEFLPHTEEEIAEVAQAMGADPKISRPGPRTARVQPDARLPGLPAGDRLSGNRRDAGSRHLRGRGRGQPVERSSGRAGNHGAAHRQQGRVRLVKARIDAMAETVVSETGTKIKYQVGTMIELPRAAVVAGEIAENADFFSFGTNDLTQTTFGISRDDAGKVPGRLQSTRASSAAIRSYRSTRRASASSSAWRPSAAARRGQTLKLGICGEHGGDPASIAFCDASASITVSCSPFRVADRPPCRRPSGAGQTRGG